MVKTQGRRGEVASEILSDIPDRFAVGMKMLALPRNSSSRRELEVEGLWLHKGLLVLKFAGVDSISEAEELVGSELQVPRSPMVSQPEVRLSSKLPGPHTSITWSFSSASGCRRALTVMASAYSA